MDDGSAGLGSRRKDRYIPTTKLKRFNFLCKTAAISDAKSVTHPAFWLINPGEMAILCCFYRAGNGILN
jgi:hypothetical protein